MSFRGSATFVPCALTIATAGAAFLALLVGPNVHAIPPATTAATTTPSPGTQTLRVTTHEGYA